jgi:aromatic ring-opening dioxygenase catalytic subunit (LigB family)
MPVLFCALREVRKKLPKPKTVCVVSAHWVTSGCHVLDVAWPKTIHDFYGVGLCDLDAMALFAPEDS